MAAIEPYYFDPNMFQNSEMIALKIVKWKIAWKKIDFDDLVKDSKSVVSFSPCRLFFESDRITSHKHGLADKTA